MCMYNFGQVGLTFNKIVLDPGRYTQRILVGGQPDLIVNVGSNDLGAVDTSVAEVVDNAGWEREFAWLRQNNDKTAMICTACRKRLARTRSKQDAAAPFVKGCSNFRREVLTKHMKSEVHMRAVGAQAAHTAEARFYCLFINVFS